jgi:glycosyltransferase involved in cell wall biosynthesis/SAM-dependent methyltransferase
VDEISDATAGPNLRVLTVLTYYRPHWTGLTRFAQRIAEGLAAGGAAVTVLTSRHDPALPLVEAADGVVVRRVRSAGRLSRTAVMPGFPLALWQELRRHDVVHLHSPMPEAALVTALARAAGVPVVITHQGDVHMPRGVVNQAIQAVMRAELGAAFRRADRVVTHNEDYLPRSQTAVAGDRARAIEPPAVIPRPDPARVERFRAAHHLEGRPVVAFAGRWVEEKGFDVLLQAAPRVLADVPEARFVFAGERTVAYESFSERCDALVQALGPAFVDAGLIQDLDELAAFYAAADVLALPSRTDCHASVQVEAALCGTPLVASDIPGARSVVTTTGAGVLVPAEDPQALAVALLSVLGDPHRFDPGLAVAADRYRPDVAIGAYRALLDEVVAAPRHPKRRPPPTSPGGFPTRSTGSTGSAGSDAATPPTVAQLVAHDLDAAYRRRIRWSVDRLRLKPGHRLLDAGAGLGQVLRVLNTAHPDVDVVAVDLDADRLRSAVPAPGSGVAVADLAHVPVPDASFDAVLCSEVIEHLADPLPAVRELRRVLRPGGRLAVTVPHADFPWTWDPLNALLRRAGRPPVRRGPLAGAWTQHERLYRPGEIADLLRSGGFVVEEVEEQTHAMLPFGHLAFYVVGRHLAALGTGVGLASTDARPSFGPLLRLIDRIDRRNERPPARARRYVNLVVAARRPEAP